MHSNSLGREAAASINHERSALAARCERGVLQQFGTRLDCTSCIAVHASFDGGTITIRTFVSEPDGRTAARVTQRGTDADALVLSVAKELRNLGAFVLFERRAS
ncbi:MAG: hypothetical protein M3P06_07025 [Acidobacteriota bacterium]|nr:hypothetical protein [Acidobacteriota bacterium]